jgi:hypothetical protein
MSFLGKLEKVTQLKRDTVEFNGEAFTVQEMDGKARDHYDNMAARSAKIVQKSANGKPKIDFNTIDLSGQRVTIVAMSLINDEKDELAFDYKSKADLDTLSGYPANFLDAIKDKALEVSGIRVDDDEDAEKKSESEEASELG